MLSEDQKELVRVQCAELDITAFLTDARNHRDPLYLEYVDHAFVVLRRLFGLGPDQNATFWTNWNPKRGGFFTEVVVGGPNKIQCSGLWRDDGHPLPPIPPAKPSLLKRTLGVGK